jgi:hypothetical protein
MEERFTFGVHHLHLLERMRASLEGEGFTCHVEVCTFKRFELHTLCAVRPHHTPVRFTPAKGGL